MTPWASVCPNSSQDDIDLVRHHFRVHPWRNPVLTRPYTADMAAHHQYLVSLFLSPRLAVGVCAAC